jgi:micrococcal nuclease
MAILALVFASGCTDNNSNLTSEMVALEALSLIEFDSNEISDNIELPDTISLIPIIWTSTQPDVISTNGEVVRPAYLDGNQEVVLTARIDGVDNDTGYVSEDFSFRVLKIEPTDTDLVYETKELLTLDVTEVSSNMDLPTELNGTTITWTSSHPANITSDGIVTQPLYYQSDLDVSLTARIELNGIFVYVSFDVTVQKETEPDVITLNTDFTDELSLSVSYTNSSFLADGIGEVELSRCVDGDTAIFSEGSQSFSVRFLGIDTPESTYRIDPWGKEASEFTCDKLENAETLVLQAEPSGERTDGNDRYLAWVWYDGRLLNLELVEQAYTGVTGIFGTIYEDEFYYAEIKTQATDLKYWGELDPNYDYSLEGVQISIEELVTNQSEYVGRKVVIQGIVTANIAGHPYIEQDGFGVYLYKGFVYTTKLAVGNEVLISGLTPTYYPDAETGALQLVDFQSYNTEVLSTDNLVTPKTVTIPELTDLMIGSLIHLENLTVTYIYENSYDDAFTVTLEDVNGNTITVRRQADASSDITADYFSVGTVLSITAPLSRYDSNLQLIIASIDDVVFE